MPTGSLITPAIVHRTAVNASLDQLHTSASEFSNGFMHQEDESVVAARLEQEQKEILQIDDIVDYDSSEESEGQIGHP